LAAIAHRRWSIRGQPCPRNATADTAFEKARGKRLAEKKETVPTVSRRGKSFLRPLCGAMAFHQESNFRVTAELAVHEKDVKVAGSHLAFARRAAEELSTKGLFRSCCPASSPE